MLLEQELELLRSQFFHRDGAGAYKLLTFLPELVLKLRVLRKKSGAKSRATKLMLQINLETQLKLFFSNIILFIITTGILMSNNTRNLPLRKSFPNPHLAFYLKQMDKVN